MTTYETLVQKLPEMAKVVNEFKGDSAQAEALRALIATIEGVPAPPQTNGTAHKPAARSGNVPPAAPREKGKSTPRRGAEIGLIPDNFLFPEGKPSVKQFVEQKKPVKQGELLVALVYYMEQIAKVEAITLSHVYTAIKTIGQKPPASLRERLKDEKSRANRLDTADSNNIKTTRTGRDFVDHDLPRASNGAEGK